MISKLLLLFFINSSFEDVPRRKPNVLFLIVDDLRTSLGCYGNRKLFTPNVDDLARKGIVFNNAYAQQALCGPSRASLLISRRPDTLRIHSNTWYRRHRDANYTTLPQYFKQHGYRTISVGKVFHPGGIHPYSNKTDDYPLSWSDVPYHPLTERYKQSKVCPEPDGHLYSNLVCPVDVDQQPGRSLPDIESTDYAVKFLRQHRTNHKPFFLAVGFHKPHVPLKFPKTFLDFYPIWKMGLAPDPNIPRKMPTVAWNPWTDLRQHDDVKSLNVSFPYGPLPKKYQVRVRRAYYAAVTYVDHQIGRILNRLDGSGLAKNTIVILTSDHGWSLGEHGEWAKYSNFEVAVKVPLIVYNPFDRSVDERSTDSLVESVDLFPSLCDMCGLPLPRLCPSGRKGVRLCSEGVSFGPVIEAANNGTNVAWKSAVFSQYPRPSMWPQWNSDEPRPSEITIMGYTMRSTAYRYTEWVGFDPARMRPDWHRVLAVELYDRRVDPREDQNLYGDQKYNRLIDRLRIRLRKGWRHALPG